MEPAKDVTLPLFLGRDRISSLPPGLSQSMSKVSFQPWASLGSSMKIWRAQSASDSIESCHGAKQAIVGKDRVVDPNEV